MRDRKKSLISRLIRANASGQPELGQVSELNNGPESAEPHLEVEADRHIRHELISQIRQRIKGGYYNSPEVLDDLSSDFAKAFNKLS